MGRQIPRNRENRERKKTSKFIINIKTIISSLRGKREGEIVSMEKKRNHKKGTLEKPKKKSSKKFFFNIVVQKLNL